MANRAIGKWPNCLIVEMANCLIETGSRFYNSTVVQLHKPANQIICKPAV